MPYYIHIRKAEVWAETKASPASYPGQVALSKRKLEPSAIARIFPRRIFSTSLTGDVTSEIAKDDWERGCWAPRLLVLGAQGEGPAFVQKKKNWKKKKKKNRKKAWKTETGKEKKSQFCFYYRFLLPTKEKSNKERGTPNGYYISIDIVKSHNVTIMALDIIIEMHAPLSSLQCDACNWLKKGNCWAK